LNLIELQGLLNGACRWLQVELFTLDFEFCIDNQHCWGQCARETLCIDYPVNLLFISHCGSGWANLGHASLVTGYALVSPLAIIEPFKQLKWMFYWSQDAYLTESRSRFEKELAAMNLPKYLCKLAICYEDMLSERKK
jgi:hypothetical protein